MIPSVPTGCTLAALLNASEYLGNLPLKTASKCVVRRATELVDVNFTVFGGIVELVSKYSTMPAALATLSDAARNEFLHELSRATPQSEVLKKASFMLRMEERSATRCSMCVAEDLGAHGFAFARSIHQIPTIKACPIHLCLLESRCGQCSTDLEPDWSPHRRKMHNVCRKCGARAEVAIPYISSEGYQAYADLLYRGMRGEAPEVKPDQLKVALERFSDLTIEHGLDLRRNLMNFWRVESWIETCACIGAPSDELYKSLVFGIEPDTVLGAYGLASFFHSCIQNDLTLPTGPSTHLPKWWFASNHLIDEDIRERAHEAGLPMKVVLKMLKGNWPSIRIAGAMKKVRDLLGTLGQREREHIRRARLMHTRKVREKRRIRARQLKLVR